MWEPQPQRLSWSLPYQNSCFLLFFLTPTIDQEGSCWNLSSSLVLEVNECRFDLTIKSPKSSWKRAHKRRQKWWLDRWSLREDELVREEKGDDCCDFWKGWFVYLCEFCSSKKYMKKHTHSLSLVFCANFFIMQSGMLIYL